MNKTVLAFFFSLFAVTGFALGAHGTSRFTKLSETPNTDIDKFAQNPMFENLGDDIFDPNPSLPVQTYSFCAPVMETIRCKDGKEPSGECSTCCGETCVAHCAGYIGCDDELNQCVHNRTTCEQR